MAKISNKCVFETEKILLNTGLKVLLHATFPDQF